MATRRNVLGVWVENKSRDRVNIRLPDHFLVRNGQGPDQIGFVMYFAKNGDLKKSVRFHRTEFDGKNVFKTPSVIKDLTVVVIRDLAAWAVGDAEKFDHVGVVMDVFIALWFDGVVSGQGPDNLFVEVEGKQYPLRIYDNQITGHHDYATITDEGIVV